MQGRRYRWPLDAIQQSTVEAWAGIFMRQGYLPTDSRENEAGFEKVAIYVDLADMLPSHIARSDGFTWKSKLGKSQDIEHLSLDLLEGDQHSEYGIVERILKRELRIV